MQDFKILAQILITLFFNYRGWRAFILIYWIINPWKSSIQTLKPSQNIILAKDQIQLSFQATRLLCAITQNH